MDLDPLWWPIAPCPRFTPEINGASRWLAVPGFTFQPIEVAKLALIVWLAATIVNKGSRLDDGWDGLVPVLAAPLLMAVTAVLQPDFKGATVLVMLTGSMLWLGGVRARFLLRMGAAALPLGILVMVLEPYRMQRIRAFLDRGEDMQGISYQINQSLISLGSGGWFGVGLGSSKQKFAFLPMAHTDFIVSIVGESGGCWARSSSWRVPLPRALGYRAARQAPTDWVPARVGHHDNGPPSRSSTWAWPRPRFRRTGCRALHLLWRHGAHRPAGGHGHRDERLARCGRRAAPPREPDSRTLQEEGVEWRGMTRRPKCAS